MPTIEKVTYSREEMVSSSEVAKHIGELLGHFKKRKAERFALMKNNRIEAVLLPAEGYEAIMEDLSYLHTALQILERKLNDSGDRVSWETLKQEYGL